MELKDSIALIIASYGALLSTFLGIKVYLNGRQSLKFIHEYDIKEKNMNIIITNRSTKSIDIINGKYFVGITQKSQALDIKLPTTIEPQQSLVVKIDLKNKDKYFEKVDKFIFISSMNKEFSYQMKNTIREDLKQYVSAVNIEQLFFRLETMSDDMDEAIHYGQKILQETEIETQKTDELIAEAEAEIKKYEETNSKPQAV